MRILYVIDFFHPHVGGTPTFFKNLVENVSRMGHKVTVVTTQAPGAKRIENYNGVKVYRFGRSREDFMVKATMYLIANRDKFDIVHTSTYSAIVPSYMFSVMKRVPKVLSVHEVWSLREWMEFTSKKGPFYFMEERMLLSLPFDMYVSPSAHTKADLEKVGIGKDKIEVVPHGVDRKVFNPRMKSFRKAVRARYNIGEKEMVGCFVGKATVFKGIHYLLDALEVAMKRRQMRFIFVLSRLHESGYRKFMERVNSSDVLRRNVIVAEASRDHDFASKIVASSDFLVMPSLTEGFGFAAAEAAAIGIPVVATKGTSLAEVLEDGRNAIFVKLRSSGDIARAISSLVSSRSLRRRLSGGKKFPEWPEVARQYVKVYQDVIRKHKEV